MKSLLFSVLYAIFNSSGAVLIKYHLRNRSLIGVKDWVGFLLQPTIIFAFLIIFISALLLFKALSLGAYSVVIPTATAINFIFTVLIGYFLFKERVNLAMLSGIALILTGLFILTHFSTQYAK
jgi:multidrug transporter EmrE-like cation transporter